MPERVKLRRKMTDFVISEISAVDKPAQEDARVILMKRKEPDDMIKIEESIAKRFIDPMEGAFTFSEALSEELKAQEFFEMEREFSPFLYSLDVSMRSIIGDTTVAPEAKLSMARAGVEEFMNILRDKWIGSGLQEEAFDELAMRAVEKSKGENSMTEKEQLQKQIEELQEKLKKVSEASEDAEAVTKMQEKIDTLQKQVEDLTAAKEQAEALAKLSDDEKAYYDKLPDDEKDQYLKLGDKERQALAKKASDQDETLVIDGRTIRKSEVGPENFEFYKAQNERLEGMQKKLDEAESKRIEAELAKRADEEFVHLPGDSAEKVAVLKAMASMDKDTAETLEKMLTAGEKASALAFEKLGHGDGGVNGDGKAHNRMSKSNGGDFMSKVSEIAKRDSISEMEAMEKAREEYPDEFASWRHAEG